jgi:hypothetical protein
LIVEAIQTFAANAIVKILGGAFAGRQGCVVSSGAKSTRLRLEAFAGRDTVLTLATADLGAITP